MFGTTFAPYDGGTVMSVCAMRYELFCFEPRNAAYFVFSNLWRWYFFLLAIKNFVILSVVVDAFCLIYRSITP